VAGRPAAVTAVGVLGIILGSPAPFWQTGGGAASAFIITGLIVVEPHGAPPSGWAAGNVAEFYELREVLERLGAWLVAENIQMPRHRERFTTALEASAFWSHPTHAPGTTRGLPPGQPQGRRAPIGVTVSAS